MGRKVTGEEALAWGAWRAGVRFVTGYPGTPSKGVFAALQALASHFPSPVPRPSSQHPDASPVFHWAANEKVALELAIGATLAGYPSLVCVKSVGGNVLLDALMTVNLTGVPSPLVIALGDDPSAWHSQNEQDTRWLALMSELPLLEPTDVKSAAKLMAEAFRLSADFSLPVIVRFPKAFAVATDEVDESLLLPVPRPSSLVPSEIGFVPSLPPLPSIASGGNAIRLHAQLHEKLRQIERAYEALLERLSTATGQGATERRDGNIAVLAIGFCATKVRAVLEAIGDLPQPLRFVPLATTFPLPRRWLLDALAGVATVLVVEEGEPIVEMQLKALMQEARFPCAVRGKLTGELPREGELTLRRIGLALRALVELPLERVEGLPDPQRPQGFTLRFCDGCPYPPFLDALMAACREKGWELVVASDPGCSIVAIGKPYELVRIKHSMGGAVNFIAALAKLERNPHRRYIALVGDSDFFHGALLGILNAAYWRAPMAVIIADNGGAAFTGGQPHLGSGFDAAGEFVPPLRMEALLTAASIPTKVVSSFDAKALTESVRWVLDYGDELRALIVREPCPFVPVWTEQGLKPKKTEGKIVGE
jgi:indolepyruvate ferredoxin oxidoreductase alpha subunit